VSLIENLAGASILLLVTYRPGYRPPWMEKSYVTQIALHRLAPAASRQVIHAVSGDERLPEPMVDVILAKAEGNPFFLVRLSPLGG